MSISVTIPFNPYEFKGGIFMVTGILLSGISKVHVKSLSRIILGYELLSGILYAYKRGYIGVVSRHARYIGEHIGIDQY